MTRDDVMRMTNEELNVAIQTHIFGIPPKYSAKSKNGSMVVGFEMTREECEELCDELVEKYRQRGLNVVFEPSPYARAYSADIAAAWQVVDRLRDLNWHVVVKTKGYMLWHCVLEADFPPYMGGAIAPTAPEAICRAALLAALKRSEAKNGGGGA